MVDDNHVGIRVGEYGIRAVPGNIILGKYTLVATGPKKGCEIVNQKTQRYFSNWTGALSALYDVLLNDRVGKNNIKIVRGLMDSQEEAYEMIKVALEEIKILPAKETL